MGYPKDLLVEPDIDEHLTCIICSDVLVSPIECMSCGRAFCQTPCFANWQENSASCPYCRSKMGFAPSKGAFLSLLLSKDVYCYNKEFGCGKVLSLKRAIKHLTECQFTKLICPNSGCRYMLFRSEMADHVKECHFREVECKYGCGATMQARDKRDHQCREKLKVKLEEARTLL